MTISESLRNVRKSMDALIEASQEMATRLYQQAAQSAEGAGPDDADDDDDEIVEAEIIEEDDDEDA